jgi:hypothetical protein
MTTNLVSKIHAGIEGTYSGASAYSTQNDLTTFTKQSLAPIPLDSGTATGQADTLFTGERTLSASASENLDFAGALTDNLGNTLTFGHIKALEIEADAGNTNSVIVGATASNQFIAGFGGATHSWTLGPGDRMVVYSKAGWAVTPSTGDLLKVANSGSGTSVKYRITALGTSN